MDEVAVEKVDPGLWSLPVPIPDNPLGHTLVYLLDADGGPVLVDAGWDDPASLRALEGGVGEAGFRLDEVQGVLVTHHHPDHHGLAGRVREASGCWVAMHREDVRVVHRHREHLDQDPEERHDRAYEALHAAGAPPDEITALLARQRELDVAMPAIPDRELEDHDVVALGGRDVQAVWTPGHSPGHTCFWLDDAQQLLAGDHLLPTITPHIGLHDPDGDPSDPLGAFLASLDRIDELDPIQVLPAHQYRFDDVAHRIGQLRRHHEERLAELTTALADGAALTLWELAEAMTWNRPWEQIPALMRRVAMGEAAAHVRRLERQGLVEVVGTAPTRYGRR